MESAQGDGSAYEYATIYAPCCDRPRALEWLDPLRNEPRFQAIEQALKYPD